MLQAACPQLSEHVEAVSSGKHQVQDDGIDGVLPSLSDAFLAGRGGETS